MLDQHGVRISHRGEIVSLVPLVQQLDQLHQLGLLGFGDNNSGLHEQAVQSLQHVVQRGIPQAVLRSRPCFFRCTSKMEMAAGVMPEMRDA